MRFLTGLFVIILMIFGMIQSPTAEVRETKKVPWDSDHKGKKYIEGYTLYNSTCSLSFLETKETEKSEKIWFEVSYLEEAEGIHPKGTWYMLGNSNDKVNHASVICTKFAPPPKVERVSGDPISCMDGWDKFADAQCNPGYTLVGGGCDFKCIDHKHTSSFPMPNENKYRCRMEAAGPVDIDRKITAHALCLKH